MSWRAEPLLAALLLTGCIQRYEVPTEPPEAQPYASVAAWRGLQPPAPKGPTSPLPDAALRLAADGDGYVDSVLLGGEGGVDGWTAVRQRVAAIEGPIVVFLGDGEPPCDRLRPWADRAVVAVLVDGDLRGEPLAAWCPEAPEP